MTEGKIVELSLPYDGKLKGNRRVRVYVPAHEEGEKLPVIYMTDGQNLFEEETTRFGSWYTREAVEDERAHSGRAAIIVGIHNDTPRRTPELAPGSIGKIRGFLVRHLILPDPEGDVFDRFVMQTVKPAVEAQFPVKTGAENTAFCGSSSGGLFAFYMNFAHPDEFGAVGAFSPALLGFYQKDWKHFIEAGMRPVMPLLYVYTGNGNTKEREMFRSVEWVRPMLEAVYPTERLHIVIRPDQLHNESAWATEFRIFLHLFLTEQEAKNTPEA